MIRELLLNTSKTYKLRYRWVIDGSPTGWQTLRSFRNRDACEKEMEKRLATKEEWMEYIIS